VEWTRSANPTSLKGKNIAILATDGFEQAELIEPRKGLDQAGAKTVVIAPGPGSIRGWKNKDWGDEVAVAPWNLETLMNRTRVSSVNLRTVK
jgi:putative intracellular protease/amidase